MPIDELKKGKPLWRRGSLTPDRWLIGAQIIQHFSLSLRLLLRTTHIAVFSFLGN